jgi:protoheme IX farnesyltransferase
LIELVRVYIEAMKPKETLLLTIIGISAAVIGAGGFPELGRLSLVAVALLIGDAGANGLTNFLDRDVDVLMERTKHRPLPSRRIYPPEKLLLPVAILLLTGLAIAWYLNPICFAFGSVGILTSVLGRKRSITHILGGVSGSAPVLIGYVAFSGQIDATIILITSLIFLWTPLHVWSLMTAYKEDFLQAGVLMLPVTKGIRVTVITLVTLSFLTFAVSIALYFVGGFSFVYLAAAAILGIWMIAANMRLYLRRGEKEAWRVYKISAYPYLGLIFLAMCADLWVQKLV